MERRLFLCALQIFILEVLLPPTAEGGAYLGCFKENRKRRKIGISPGDFDPYNLTPEICQTKCGAYKYAFAGLTAGRVGTSYCFCGKENTLTLEAESNCDTPCTGDNLKNCGSQTHVSVYQTNEPITGLEMNTAISGVVQTSNPVTFTVTIGSGADVVYKMDYDDGSGQTTANVTGIFDRSYSLPGTYNAAVYATDVSETVTPEERKVAVEVDSPVSDLQLVCPTDVATYTEVTCTTTLIEGSSVNTTVTYNDGVAPAEIHTETYAIADPVLSGAGPGIPSKGVVSPSAFATGGTVQAPAAEISGNGILIGIELTAANAGDGTLTVLVLQPDCGSNEYCYKDNTCVSPGSCVSDTQTSCTSPNYFCVTARNKCANTCAALPVRYNAASLALSRKVRHKVQLTGISAGYQYQSLTSQGLDVYKGDVIGHEVGPVGVRLGVLGLTSPDDVYTDFVNSGLTGLNVGNAVASAGFSSTTKERHFLKAVVSSTTKIHHKIEYTQPGTSTFQVAVYNIRLSGPPQVTQSVNINVLEGVDKAVIVAADFIKTGMTYDYEVEAVTGQPVTIDWLFDSAAVTTGSLTQAYAFPSRGCYNVSVNISNAISWKENQTNVCVEDQIISLIMTISTSPIIKGASTPITINMASGSDYDCTLSFSDGPSVSFNWNDYPPGSDYNYSFPTYGSITIDLSCANNVSSLTHTLAVQVVEEITGVSLDKYGGEKNQPFSIAVNWLTGSDITFMEVLFDTIPLAITSSSSNSLGCEEQTISSTGIHLVNVTLTNIIGTVTHDVTFAIEVAITNPVVNCSLNDYAQPDYAYPLLPVGATVTCDVDMDEGTSVLVTLDYNDTYTDYHTCPAGSAWVSPGPFSHTFNDTGFHYFEITVENSYSSQTFPQHLMVMESVDNLELSSNSPQPFTPPGQILFYISVSSGSPPNEVTGIFDWGDKHSDTILNVGVGTYAHLYYDQSGPMTMSVNVSNLVSSKLLTTNVNLVEPVTDLQIICDPPHAGLNVPVKVKVKANTAPLGSDAMITWDFGDGSPTVGPRARTGISPDGEDIELHTYTALSSSNTIRVTMVTALETVDTTYNIKVMNPIDTNVVPSCTSPIDFTATSGRMTFTVIINTSPVPDDLDMMIQYGDGSNSTVERLDLTSTTHIRNYNYAEGGLYQVVIYLYNEASSEEFPLPCGIYDQFENVDGTVLRLPLIPIGGSPQLGYGSTNNIFPISEETVFRMTRTKGTLVYYELDAQTTDLSTVYTCNSTDDPDFAVYFPAPGTWDVTITAMNEIHQADKTFQIVVEEPCSQIYIDDYEIQTGAFENKTFGISFDYLGTDVCLMCDFGEGTIQTYGSIGRCTTNYPGVMYDGTVPLTNPVNLTREYEEMRTYQMTCTASNSFSSAQNSFSFSVSTIDCSRPHVEILFRHKNFYAPENFPKSLRKRSISQLNINCDYTLENVKQWYVHMIDPLTGSVISAVDISSLDSATKAELSLPPRFLDYGLYRFKYIISMLPSAFPSGETYSDTKETFVQITKTDLVVSVFEYGDAITKGHCVDMTISPQSLSYDPDTLKHLDDPSLLATWEWRCRKTNETYPSVENRHLPYTVIELSGPISDTGGCFRQGPGTIDITTGELTFTTCNMYVNETYEFEVTAHLDTRSTTAKAYLTIVDGLPPEVEIECKLQSTCKPNSVGKKVMQNSPLGLAAYCRANCDPNLVTYQWTVYCEDYRYKKPGDLYGWRRLVYLFNFIDGLNSDELTISESLFLHYKDCLHFQIRLETTNPDGVVGETRLDLMINTPPQGGSCDVTPLSGIGQKTMSTINCTGYTDEDGISYSALLYEGSSNEKFPLTSSFDANPTWATTLPIGQERSGNYYLNLYLKIRDSLGSEGLYHIGEVESVPGVTIEDYRQLLADSNDYKEKIGAKAELGEVTKALQMDVVGANIIRTTSLEGEFYGIGSAGDFTPTDYDQGPRDNAFKTTVNNPDAVATSEENRDVLVQNSDLWIEYLSKCTIDTMDDVIVAAGGLVQLTKYVDLCARSCQTKTVSLLQSFVDIIEREAGETGDINTLTDTCRNIITVAAAIQTAGRFNEDYPSNADKDAAADSVNEVYSTNQDSEKPGLSPDAVTLEDAEEEGVSMASKQQQLDLGDSLGPIVEDARSRCKRVLKSSQTKSDTFLTMASSKTVEKIKKNRADKCFDDTIDVGPGKIEVPSFAEMNLGIDPNTTIIIEAAVSVSAPSGNIEGRDKVGDYAAIVSLSVEDAESGNLIQVKDTAVPIKLSLPLDKNQPLDDPSLANPDIPESRPWESCFYHSFLLPGPDRSIHIDFELTDTSVQILVLIKIGAMPNATTKDFDHFCMIPDEMANRDDYGDDTTPNHYSCMMDVASVKSILGSDASYPVKVYVGTRQMAPEEYDTFVNASAMPKFEEGSGRFTTNYRLRSYCAGCNWLDTSAKRWRSDGCEVGPLTNTERVDCRCTHLTTFAGGWVVVPNTIDWNFVFSNADFFKNPTLYITEIVIVAFYIIAVIWARRQDRQDVTKLGLAPLLDNDPRDKYYYEIMVYTGMRVNAGTDSKVSFVLSGEEEETDVRTFTDEKRKIFRRGATDGFLMSVPSTLGALMYLRLWHDNSGKGKFGSWYVNHIIIRNVQTDKKYFFIINRWFAVEEDDGQVDRVIPVAGKEQMTEFSVMFSERASKNLSDGHLWFSVVARPPQSRFTRVQRVSCCLCLLYLTMLANAMFYETGDSGGNVFTFGPFALSPEQIYIGVISNLIIFPVTFLIIMLFRKSRPRKLRPSRVEEALKAKPQKTTSMTDVRPVVKSSLDINRPGSSLLLDGKRPDTSMSTSESSSSATKGLREAKKKKKKFQLHWIFTYVAWVLLWLTVLVSAAFVTFYGIMFQDLKCKKWITSMLISFFASVFITQPIKVFLFAIIFSLIIKNPGGSEDEEEDEEECKMSKDEELLHEPDRDEFGFAQPRRAGYKPEPPDPKLLEACRKHRMKEIQMWAVIREIVFYAFFLWILMVISYRNRSPESFYYKYSLEQVFILSNDTDHAYNKIKNEDETWAWIKSGLLKGIRAGPYYNEDPPYFLRGYINDKASRIMGYATIRQVRVKKDSCKIPAVMDDIITECNDAYDMAVEEQGSYAAEWQSTDSANATYREEYQYQTAKTLNGYPYWGEMALYGGGGYLVRLNKDLTAQRNQLEQLQNESWIDRYTRAVFVEFTTYNPSINLFAVATLLLEFRPSGGVWPSYRFEPCMLLPYMNSAALFQIVCEIVYFLFTLWFIIKEVRAIIKEKRSYFGKFWNLIEFGICAMSVTAIVIYFYRMISVNNLTNYFKETHGTSYMKFQYVGYWSEILTYIIAWLVFLASLKFLKLLRFNKKISLLADVLNKSSNALIHFSIIFNIVFLAFIQVFYLIYVSNLSTFKTFVSSCEAGIVMMMGKFDIYNMQMVNPVLTQIFLFFFVVTITFIIVNMFLSILNETFGSVRKNVAQQKNDYEIIDFMMNRFKMWTGVGTPSRDAMNPNDLERERRAQHYNSLEGRIDYFPNQIDRFLSSISHMYMQKHQFDEFLTQGAYGKMAMKAQMASGGPPPPMPSNAHPPPSWSRMPAPPPDRTRLTSGGRNAMTDVQTH